MKTVKIIQSAILAAVLASGCKKEAFVEANTSPATLYEVEPEDQFLAAATGSQDDFEYYYDFYRGINLWMQYTTTLSLTGNALNFTIPSANFNYRYGKIYYERVGTRLADARKIIADMPEAERAQYVYQGAIIDIFDSYYAFYVSDINGSMPYTEAFQGRYGGILTPKYTPQQELFALLDQKIKAAVATLKSSQSVQQKMFGTNDPFFGGSSDQALAWTKAGNALRLKIGLRLMKADLPALQAIATEVIADPVQMSAVSDSWQLTAGPAFANATGNYNPVGFAASKPIVDFMLDNDDPRLRIFYRPNEADGDYVGGFPSPDESRLPANQPLYEEDGKLSEIQHRLFAPNYDEGNGAGDGIAFFPYLTYAEYCFIRADLAARNIVTTGGTAQEWYEKGVRASIEYYNERAVAAEIEDYATVTPAEINDYMQMPDVAFNPAKALEQIACQAYLDLYRNPSEGWAWWKRTGYPNTTSVLEWSELTSNGTVMQLPRRASINVLPTTNLNFENQQAAIAEMQQNAGFGSGPNDVFGRVWWDQP